MLELIKNQVISSVHGDLATDYCFKADGQAKPIVIYAHGFNGFKDWGNFDLIAQRFAEAGFFFVKFNFSHNGTTLENPTEFADLERYGNNNYTKELDDLARVIDTVYSDYFPYKTELNGQINLLGHSRGGGIVLLAGHDERISKIVTWASIAACTSPFTRWSAEKMQEWKENGVQYYENKRTDQQLPLYYQLYEDCQENAPKLNIKERIKSLNKPLLLIHGRNDPAVPHQAAEELHALAPQSELILTEDDHVFGRKHPWTSNELPQATKVIVNQTISFLSL